MLFLLLMETQTKGSWADDAKRVMGGTNLAEGLSPEVMARMMASSGMPVTTRVFRSVEQRGLVSGVKKIADGYGDVAIGAVRAATEVGKGMYKASGLESAGKKLNELGTALGEKAYDKAEEFGLAGPSTIKTGATANTPSQTRTMDGK